MIRIYLADTDSSKNTDEGALFCGLFQGIEERIANTGASGRKKERRAAYALLCLALSELGVTERRIEFTDRGKPYIVNSEFSFSIAHTKELAAVIVCDDGRSVGIDIEELSQKNISAARKFFERYEGKYRNLTADVLFLKNDIKTTLVLDIEEKKVNDAEALIGWCVTEAALKCDGGGFASMGNITKILEKSALQSEILSVSGKKYVLAVAVS